VEENIEFYRTLLDNLNDGVFTLDRDRKIVFWNKGAEQLTGFSKAEVLGRKCSDEILVHIDGEGHSLCDLACPVEQTLIGGCSGEREVLLRHKEGHRVPVLVRVFPIIDPKGLATGAVQVFSDNLSKVKLKQRIEELQKQSLLDPLTKLANRRAMEIYLESRREEFRRFRWPFGVLFIDIDHFKGINDRYGHMTGDDILKMVAKTLSRNYRPFDIVGRWGGEEFLAIIANVDAEELQEIAERYRVFIRTSTIKRPQGVIRVTVSIGATLCRIADSSHSLVKRADDLMYRCKKAGRDCVRIDIR
jgi:diguanylate cyclase (GGDEF)-like protein/PAS domain S-box-containing protein